MFTPLPSVLSDRLVDELIDIHRDAKDTSKEEFIEIVGKVLSEIAQ